MVYCVQPAENHSSVFLNNVLRAGTILESKMNLKRPNT